MDEDGRWIVVDGRRWRASDPSIPEALRTELVAELMSARRAVSAGRRAADDDAVAAARVRVGDAKRALGERGRAWWLEPTSASDEERLRSTILTLARHRSPKTTCPSDAARAAGGERWRSLMDQVRSVAADLQRDGAIEVLQRGEPLDISTARGPVRIRLV